MSNYLSETRKMAQEGNHEEALRRFIWYDDHVLEYEKSQSAVRLSFALSYWKDLADVYPPALEELKARQRTKTNEIIKNGKPLLLFKDVVALNKTLDQNEKTAIVFETISSKFPERAKHYWIYAQDELFAEKRFDIIKNYLSNPMRKYREIEEFYTEDLELIKYDTSAQAQFENIFVGECLILMEYCIYINDLESVKEIQKRAYAILPDHRLRGVD